MLPKLVCMLPRNRLVLMVVPEPGLSSLLGFPEATEYGNGQGSIYEAHSVPEDVVSLPH